jgi:hypothetical protein
MAEDCPGLEMFDDAIEGTARLRDPVVDGVAGFMLDLAPTSSLGAAIAPTLRGLGLA